MARLTIPDEQTFATFTVVTSTTEFPITFSLFAKADLTVLVDGVALDQSAFSFSGTVLDGGGYDGGTVTLNSAVDDVTVRIERNVAPARTSNFAPASTTPVGSVDQALNRLTATQQDLDRRQGESETALDAFAGDVADVAADAAAAEAARAAAVVAKNAAELAETNAETAETNAEAAAAAAAATLAGAAVKANNLSDMANVATARGTLGEFATRTAAVAATVLAAVTHIKTVGYAAAGDGGGALYKRVGSEPTHAAKFQSADGAWWAYVPGADGVNVKALGATGDRTADDTTAIHNARDCGLSASLIFPTGTYETTGLVFSESDTIANLHFCPGSQLLLVASSARICLDIQKALFSITGALDISGTGTTADGLATMGLRHGTALVGKSYLTIDRVRIRDKFSARCFVSYGCVNVTIRRADINAGNPAASTAYGMSFEMGVTSGGTFVKIGQAYISGGIRGFNGKNVSWMSIEGMAIEYAGGSVSEGVGVENGALHLEGCANTIIYNLYGEQNQRNRVFRDTTPVIIAGDMFDAVSAADVITYSALDAGLRGFTEVLGNTVQTRFLTPVAGSTYDLEAGELVVPHDGGHTRLGGFSCFQTSGTLASSGTWYTIATLDGQDTGAIAPFNLVRYVYDVWVGYAGADTGTDYGVVRRGVLTSQGGGTVTSWLRISSNNLLQINAASGSAGGLDWGLTLQRIAAGPLA